MRGFFFTAFLFLLMGNAEASHPQILFAGVSSDELTSRKDDYIRITAIVTDPDGIDDLIGGVIKTAGGRPVGVFATSDQEGSYQFDLNWNDFRSARTLDLPTGGAEEKLVLEFYDQGGFKAQKEIKFLLRCENSEKAACDGQCFDFKTDKDHCGACGKSLKDWVTSLKLPNGVNRKSAPFCSSGKRGAEFNGIDVFNGRNCNEICKELDLTCVEREGKFVASGTYQSWVRSSVKSYVKSFRHNVTKCSSTIRGRTNLWCACGI